MKLNQKKTILNFLIESELRLHHIEIPFPQRDLHIRSSDIDSSALNLLQPKTKNYSFPYQKYQFIQRGPNSNK